MRASIRLLQVALVVYFFLFNPFDLCDDDNHDRHCGHAFVAGNASIGILNMLGIATFAFTVRAPFFSPPPLDPRWFGLMPLLGGSCYVLF